MDFRSAKHKTASETRLFLYTGIISEYRLLGKLYSKMNNEAVFFFRLL